MPIENLLDQKNPDPVALLLVGPSGNMKTMTLAEFPEPQLWIVGDPGHYSGLTPVLPKLRKNKSNFVIKTKDASFTEVFNYIISKRQEYKSILFDSITFIQKDLLAGIMGKTSKIRPTFDEWGDLANQTNKLLLAALESPAHVGASTLEQIEKDENTGRILGVPSLYGKLSYEISGIFRTVLHLAAQPKVGGPPQRYAYSVEDGMWSFPKDSTGKLEWREEHPGWISKLFKE